MPNRISSSNRLEKPLPSVLGNEGRELRAIEEGTKNPRRGEGGAAGAGAGMGWGVRGV